MRRDEETAGADKASKTDYASTTDEEQWAGRDNITGNFGSTIIMKYDPGKTLITGATGYLGRHVAVQLLDAGVEMRLFVRDPERLDPLLRENCEVLTGDLLNNDSIQNAVDKCDTVIHAAAMVKRWTKDKSLFRKINVAATEQLIGSAMRAGAKKIIYTSSFMATGPSDDEEPRTESTPISEHEPHNEYEKTKREALKRVREEAKNGAPVVVLVPGVVYGPGAMTDGNIVAFMIRDYVTGKLPGILGGGDKIWSFAFVEDVARAHLLALDKGVPGREYIIGGANKTSIDFFNTLEEISKLPPPKFHIPYWLAKVIGTLQVGWSEISGREPKITSGEIGVYEHSWALDSTYAVKELGYEITPFREAMERTCRWIMDSENINEL